MRETSRNCRRAWPTTRIVTRLVAALLLTIAGCASSSDPLLAQWEDEHVLLFRNICRCAEAEMRPATPAESEECFEQATGQDGYQCILELNRSTVGTEAHRERLRCELEALRERNLACAREEAEGSCALEECAVNDLYWECRLVGHDPDYFIARNECIDMFFE